MAKLVHGYKDLEPATVQIVVIANLVLEPREIVVGVGAVFPLKLMQLKQGRFVGKSGSLNLILGCLNLSEFYFLQTSPSRHRFTTCS